MAGFSSLIPKTSLKRAVNLSAPLSTIPAARNLFPGGGRRNVGERASNLHKAIRNAGTLTRPFHRLLGANQTNKPAFLRVQSMSYQFVADSHSPRRPSLETEDDVQDGVHSSKKENAETPRKHQMGENIPKKDKIKFLVNTLLDIEDNKEAVYGALDAWVAWERNFPIASLKRVIAILEKEHQWHRMVQVIKWILSKGQGTTMGTYGQLIRALDMDRRAEEAHAIWRKKIGHDLHSVPWQLCLQMTRIYFRNNMLQELVKLFRDLERYDRKPPDKHIVQIVADAYELLGMVEEKERVLEKYSSLFLGATSDEQSRRSSRKKKKPAVMNHEAKAEDAVDASKAELDQESEGCH
ncbi:PREDICTED: pentatricopeptide repeat-containing protein At4g21190-like isoform X1 [Brassica oleracea var. oleracea]|uniref:pentatricopeptide repeat-containing protein At4g21190-like isoform X1 n=1 Tax=Brassica oleracea var. oleracea TaxID=109376 RepID=UPI0006A6D498|nr:PREDICTED: pentatricopeptide repeat-containing protein At4g21190-like isoform X1 [Brassica oleracea var. oleracea]